MPPSEAAPTALHLVLSWQPPFAASDVQLAQLCRRLYTPLLDAVAELPDARLTVALDGHLLDHLAREEAPLLAQLGALQGSGRVEVLGGPFYGALPALTPESDLRAQVQMANEFWHRVVGHAPTGFYLDGQAWIPELPLLLADTGLDYGFVDRAQLDGTRGAQAGLVSLERGGQRLGAFVIDAELSTALMAQPAETFVERAAARAAQVPQNLLTVVGRPEALAAEQAPDVAAWLQELVEAVAAAPTLRWALPEAQFAARPLAWPMRLAGAAPEAGGRAQVPPPVVPPLPGTRQDALYRRMLCASDRLREAVETMEDEGLENVWSGKLATAQRQLFSAQSGVAYGPDAAALGRQAAVVRRLVAAERTAEGLMHGGEFMVSEALDLDGDLQDDVIVNTRHLWGWLQPARGGALCWLEDRAAGQCLFAGDSPGPIARGMRLGLAALATGRAAFFGNAEADLLSEATAWRTQQCGILQTTPQRFALDVRAEAQLPEAGQLALGLQLQLPMDQVALSWTLQAEGPANPGVCLLLVLPWRLDAAQAALSADGAQLAADSQNLSQVRTVRLQAIAGKTWEVSASAPLDWWWHNPNISAQDAALVALIPAGTDHRWTLNLRQV